jgi:hypothetical protein
VSRLPKAFPLGVETWQPAPVLVRTHDVVRIGPIVRSKYVER